VGEGKSHWRLNGLVRAPEALVAGINQPPQLADQGPLLSPLFLGLGRVSPSPICAVSLAPRTAALATVQAAYGLGRSALTGFTQTDGVVVPRFAERGEVEADLLVCADGSQSETRRQLLREVERHYAGYVAWRGMLEAATSPAPISTRGPTCDMTIWRSRVRCHPDSGPNLAEPAGLRCADSVAKVGTARALRNDRIDKPARLIHCCAFGRSCESILRSWALKRVLQQYLPIRDMETYVRTRF
jgi:hypothetical protein